MITVRLRCWSCLCPSMSWDEEKSSFQFDPWAFHIDNPSLSRHLKEGADLRFSSFNFPFWDKWKLVNFWNKSAADENNHKTKLWYFLLNSHFLLSSIQSLVILRRLCWVLFYFIFVQTTTLFKDAFSPEGHNSERRLEAACPRGLHVDSQHLRHPALVHRRIF